MKLWLCGVRVRLLFRPVFGPQGLQEEQRISDPRTNERIRVPEVRLVGPAGEQVGVVSIDVAIRLAQEADLDLVEVAPNSKPPVAKIMDYGKFKYEAAQKAKEARRNQANTILKEVRFRLKIDVHDYETKRKRAESFLKDGDKVKAMILFRGREQSRPDQGVRLLKRFAEDVSELGSVESSPMIDGRNMVMIIGPLKTKTEAKAEQNAKRDAQKSASKTASVAAKSEASATEKPAPVITAVEAALIEATFAKKVADTSTAPVAKAPVAKAPAAKAPAAKAPAAKAPEVSAPAVSAPVTKAATASAPKAATAVKAPVASKPAATPAGIKPAVIPKLAATPAGIKPAMTPKPATAPKAAVEKPAAAKAPAAPKIPKAEPVKGDA
ncbi:MAG: translation initiation factor IF-3 [Actinomycetales bacterium]|nr:translation initiation factor IF-3 [Actinomycetales bacterium]